MLTEYFAALAQRLERVRVMSGDWTRVTSDTVTKHNGITGIFLDPPYSAEKQIGAAAYCAGDNNVAHAVREWAIEHGDDPLFRIALCGYEGEHDMPGDWECVAWKAHGGYGSQGEAQGRANKHRERIWFSPHCIQADLFSGQEQEVFT